MDARARAQLGTQIPKDFRNKKKTRKHEQHVGEKNLRRENPESMLSLGTSSQNRPWGEAESVSWHRFWRITPLLLHTTFRSTAERPASITLKEKQTEGYYMSPALPQ